MSDRSHSAASHPGAVREENQDAWLCRPEIGLFAVADGVGAHASGEIASGTIVEGLRAIPASLPPDELVAAVRSALRDAHDQLLQLGAAREPSVSIASTVVVLTVHEAHFACLWAGDSRCYRLREGVLSRLTTDHSVVQELASDGLISEEEMAGHPHRNVITKAIGAGEPGLILDKVVGDTQTGDVFLLCSDGLYTTLEASDIARMIAEPGHAAETLVEAAVAQGARDNVTAVISMS